MRIWSIHPKYLDSKGLVALWRETLLAKKVLEGNTKGYVKHPQLVRFRNDADSLGCLNYYLYIVWEEAVNRDYSFDKSKFTNSVLSNKINVTRGQIIFEQEHLLNKLKKRNLGLFKQLRQVGQFEPHPLFEIIEGGIEKWEKE